MYTDNYFFLKQNRKRKISNVENKELIIFKMINLIEVNSILNCSSPSDTILKHEYSSINDLNNLLDKSKFLTSNYI